MGWSDQNGRIHTFGSEDASEVVTVGAYTVTLVAADPVGSGFANFTSTLEVIVDDDVDNGTDIICQVFRKEDHLLIYKTSNPIITFTMKNIHNYYSVHFRLSISSILKTCEV